MVVAILQGMTKAREGQSREDCGAHREESSVFAARVEHWGSREPECRDIMPLNISASILPEYRASHRPTHLISPSHEFHPLGTFSAPSIRVSAPPRRLPEPTPKPWQKQPSQSTVHGTTPSTTSDAAILPEEAEDQLPSVQKRDDVHLHALGGCGHCGGMRRYSTDWGIDACHCMDWGAGCRQGLNLRIDVREIGR